MSIISKTVKALTISQPYASLIAYGEKFVENRRWETNYRGLLLIHAGKGTQHMDLDEMREDNLPAGAVVAVARLSACLMLVRILQERNRVGNVGSHTWRELADHEHTEGPWCWVLDSVMRLPTPVPCKGAQGLWAPSEELLAAVNAQIYPTPAGGETP